jgi:hypothetical protein
MSLKVVEINYKKPSEAKRRLKKMTTKEIMSIRRGALACGGEFEYGIVYDMEEIKAELATREHIPNKIEGKAIRRAKAQGPKKEGKGRRRR